MNEEALAGYLHSHAHLEPLLNAFIREAAANLPKQTELTVELYRDRETPSEEIVLWARHPNYPEDFHQLIKRVRSLVRRDTNLLPPVTDQDGKITLCTDFAHPHAA